MLDNKRKMEAAIKMVEVMDGLLGDRMQSKLNGSEDGELEEGSELEVELELSGPEGETKPQINDAFAEKPEMSLEEKRLLLKK
jgi:hypothetical protein